MEQAGVFGDWLAALTVARRSDGAMDVPCGPCTACCTSGLFVHVEPDEVDVLRAIPGSLRFPAPGRPPGHVVLPVDEHGRCPMLVDGTCAIYETRPRACRRFDCRIFAAAGVVPDQPLIAQRVAGWRFSYRTGTDEEVHAAVRAAAVRIRSAGNAPRTASEIALRAIDDATEGGASGHRSARPAEPSPATTTKAARAVSGRRSAPPPPRA